MEVNYVLNIEDYVAFYRYYLKTSPQAPYAKIIRWIVFPLLFMCAGFSHVLALVQEGWEAFDPVRVVLGLAIVLFWIFWRPIIVRFARWNVSRRDKAKLASPHRLTLTPEKMLYLTEDSTMSMNWSAIDRIGATADHAFIFTASNEGQIVPRRAFASEEAFRAFIETAREYREEALEARDSPSPRRLASPEWKADVAKSFRPPEVDEHLRKERPNENPQTREDTE